MGPKNTSLQSESTFAGIMLIWLMTRVYCVKLEDHLWWLSIIPELYSLLLVHKLRLLRSMLMLPWIMYVTLHTSPDASLTSGTIHSRCTSRPCPSRYLRPAPNTYFYLDIILKRRKLYSGWNIFRIPLHPRRILPRHGSSLTRPYRFKSTKRGGSKLEWGFEIRNLRIWGWTNMRMGSKSH